MKKRKIVLIDGHSILTRAFFGVPDLTTTNGLHTNAVFGFLNIMFKIIDEEQPDDLMVAFDVKQPTFRHLRFEGYKGTRKPMPAELHQQVPLIQDVLASMNIHVATLPGYEADDILGTVAKQAEREGYDVTVVSGDRDLLQLASENILIRIPKTKQGGTEIENYHAEDVVSLYGVSPLEFIDMKGLMGDTSDNIPGVKSVGEKTAAKLIQQYKTIENIYEHIEEVKPERTKNALIADEENARLSKELATICTNAPLELDLKECKISELYNPEAYKLMKGLGFKSMLRRFDENIASETNDFDAMNNLTVLHTLDEWISLKEYLSKNCAEEFVGYSHFFADEFLSCCVAISHKDKVWILESGDGLTSDDLRTALPFLQSTKCKISLFDLKKILKQIDLEPDACVIYDCMVCAYLLNPIHDTYQYEYVLEQYLGIQTESQEDILGKISMEQMMNIDKTKVYKIIASQSLAASKSIGEIVASLEETNMHELYLNIEYPLIYVLDSMEKEGVLVDENSLKQYADTLAINIGRLEQEIHDLCGEQFNINSPKQLGVVLFEKMGLSGGKKTKTGYSTSADVLEKLAADNPVVEKILEYRQLTKLKSTYADGLRNYIQYDGRIHGTFHQTITATGRISSADPNLQNIPIRMESGRKIREVFVPKSGYVFVDADYSQIELRILAHMSGDENLISAYNSEQDIHKITASQVFGVPLEEVTSQLRRNAKAVNFGIVYGISSFGLSQDLSISKKEAGEYINQYFATYPKVKGFLDETVETAKKNGYTTTLYQRRRPIPELHSSNFMQRSFGERAAMNSAVQGTAADIMKIAMIAVYRRLKKENLQSRLLLQVHDELLIETAKNEVDIVQKIVKEEMSNAAALFVKLEVGIATGENWMEAH